MPALWPSSYFEDLSQDNVFICFSSYNLLLCRLIGNIFVVTCVWNDLFITPNYFVIHRRSKVSLQNGCAGHQYESRHAHKPTQPICQSAECIIVKQIIEFRFQQRLFKDDGVYVYIYIILNESEVKMKVDGKCCFLKNCTFSYFVYKMLKYTIWKHAMCFIITLIYGANECEITSYVFSNHKSYNCNR